MRRVGSRSIQVSQSVGQVKYDMDVTEIIVIMMWKSK